MDKNEKLQLVKDSIGKYKDFPKEGILFYDVFGILKSVKAFQALKDLLVEHALFLEINTVVGLDSRGFLFGPMISNELGKPFFPIRKKGKLPGSVSSITYSLEYGEAEFEIQNEKLSGKRVLIVDDLLATGGTMAAAVQLLQNNGAEVIQCLVIIELKSLKGRKKISVPVHSLIQYD